ncbi:FAD-binding oxidoreductase [Microbacterium terricola]|uniref:Oxidoreductase n=1 Tax=Microbacterium terricola TaxID=344163 RepID=A0ABM8DWK6_9MICO|nr:FAD-binding oxidoreductase [Microbacterium terricola]UYK39287.1 FAD-binding oxidoreductase [Microbacterium terricola]BDV29992.1 oxidoreductase [Microbacterium terricola]
MIVGDWHPARVADVVPSTSHARLLRLEVPGWPGNLPGQHLDIRLTAEDGYQAERSYSIGSWGPDATVELGVDRVPDGEVSPYLVDVIEPGDQLEVKGPLGAYFVWDADDPSPVQLIAGGSGVVPLVAMARARAAMPDGAPFRLLYSVRSPADALYGSEVEGLADAGLDVTWVYTRSGPPGWTGPTGRLTPAGVAAATWPLERNPRAFVCGPTGFVESVADMLVSAGWPPERVRTERFGGA